MEEKAVELKTTVDDYEAKWAKQHEEEAAEMALLREAIFNALAATDIASIEVTFSGSGDSGQIDEVGAFDASNNVVSIRKGVFCEHGEEQVSVLDAIENFCNFQLGSLHGGWENNDGGHGTFDFDVAKRTINFTMNQAYVEYDTSTHDV